MSKMQDFLDFQENIERLRAEFSTNLCKNLDIVKIRSPIYLKNKFLSDTLDGSQRMIIFDFKDGETGNILHSLAKWKRCILHKYDFEIGYGIVTDMIAIRRDEIEDDTHSYYVDQWDWEKVISEKDRTFYFLKETVLKIYKAFKKTDTEISKILKQEKKLPEELVFISTQELADEYPYLTPEEREEKIVKIHPAIFLYEIGHKLETEKQERHGIRASDYDDWKLNGDLIFYHKPLDCALEISSMGIRVNSQSLKSQISESQIEINKIESTEHSYDEYQQSIINDEFPLTIGGGIGQSRVLMFFFGCESIKDVQGLAKVFN